jgi:hypothetical protein
MEMLSQRGVGSEAGLARDLVHRQVGGLHEVTGPVDPLLDQPASRG